MKCMIGIKVVTLGTTGNLQMLVVQVLLDLQAMALRKTFPFSYFPFIQLDYET